MAAPRIRVGVGGWVYEPWRDNFYPRGWPHSRELEYASQRLSAIEINGTYYSTPTRQSVAKWRDSTPEDFVFSVKASRFATNRRVLAEAGESVARFIGSGITELGPKLGPIVWQFATSKRFDPVDFEAFLKLLPRSADGLPLRHVMDVRHESFKTPEYLALARRHGVATVLTESDEYPALFDAQADLVYARIMRTEAAHARRLCTADAGPAGRLRAAAARRRAARRHAAAGASAGRARRCRARCSCSSSAARRSARRLRRWR